jgi:hypothetical protein
VAGLLGSHPAWLAEIGCIAAGAALLLGGAAVGGHVARFSPGGAPASKGGTAADVVGGVAAIALGILALVGIAPWPLTSIAVISLGAALLLSSAIPAHAAPEGGSKRGRAAGGVQLLAGVAASVLGVLALLGMQPLWLVLVGVLVAGSGLVVSGAAMIAAAGPAGARRYAAA